MNEEQLKRIREELDAYFKLREQLAAVMEQFNQISAARAELVGQMDAINMRIMEIGDGAIANEGTFVQYNDSTVVRLRPQFALEVLQLFKV